MKNLRNRGLGWVGLAVLAGSVGLASAATDGESKRVPLEIDLPRPVPGVTPPPPSGMPNLEPLRAGPRPPILVPEGTVNLARNKPVTSSDKDPVLDLLDVITDGDKGGGEGCFSVLRPGLQWIQIDLGETAPIHAITLWHYHATARVYHDVVVQISDDPEFAKDVHTVFNNDHDNSSGLGVGRDLSYVETFEGKLIEVKGATGRYVRLYSRGNTTDDFNHYIEVEVYGVPPEP
jgi:hypothetical protein